MKKIISVLLSAIIVLSCMSVAFASEKDSDLNFAVASDIHYATPEEELTATNDDPIFWYASRRAAMDNESGFILDSFLSQCENDDHVDFVLISGDITDSGKFLPEQHDEAAAKLKAFEERSGKQVYVIPGNHDLSIDGFLPEDFKRVYADFGYDHALDIAENDCSYSANLGDKYLLIALDSCDPSRSTGDGMSNERINWVKEQTERAKADGRYPILMMHHNLLEHMPVQTILSKDFIIANHLSTAEKFANWGIKLVFSGHEHCSDVTSYTSTKGNVISDLATTALSMYPLEYRLISINDEAITYSNKKVEKIDTAALAATVEGYTPEMLAAMDADLNAFSKGYLKAGVQYRLEKGLFRENLGIDEDAIYADLVFSITDGLINLLRMPLYGEESIQQIGKEYGIEIPDSKYKNGWDLATDLVAWHYSGGESLTLDSTEVTILMRTVALVLREEFAILRDELYLNAADDILSYVGITDGGDLIRNLGKKVYGHVTAPEYLLLSIASPLLYAFAYDVDEIDDNNGILDGYGTVNSDTNLSNIGKNVMNFFEKVILYIGLIIKYAAKIFVV